MDVRVLVPQAIRGRPPAWGLPVHELGGQTMGTVWSVRLVAPAALRLEGVRQAIVRELDDVIAQMSQWEPGSLLSRFNRAGIGSRHALPPSFACVMDAALRIAAASDGAFDPTVGEWVRHWGFGPPGDGSPPRCDWRVLQWDGCRLSRSADIQLDLSAIAKGHAVDRVSQMLGERGLVDHLVDIGGELRGEGFKPDGQPWWVEVEPPALAAAGLTPTRIALHGLAVATSGDYRRFHVDAQGRRRSHTIDPRHGEPIAHGLASVSVLHRSAMWADGWATALMAMGAEAGLRFADGHGLAALFIQRTGPAADGFQESASAAFEELLS